MEIRLHIYNKLQWYLPLKNHYSESNKFELIKKKLKMPSEFICLFYGERYSNKCPGFISR